jgi:hypothetical protein
MPNEANLEAVRPTRRIIIRRLKDGAIKIELGSCDHGQCFDITKYLNVLDLRFQVVDENDKID